MQLPGSLRTSTINCLDFEKKYRLDLRRPPPYTQARNLTESRMNLSSLLCSCTPNTHTCSRHSGASQSYCYENPQHRLYHAPHQLALRHTPAYASSPAVYGAATYTAVFRHVPTPAHTSPPYTSSPYGTHPHTHRHLPFTARPHTQLSSRHVHTLVTLGPFGPCYCRRTQYRPILDSARLALRQTFTSASSPAIYGATPYTTAFSTRHLHSPSHAHSA